MVRFKTLTQSQCLRTTVSNKLYFTLAPLNIPKHLENILKKDHLMKSGDRYEFEIRGCSIWATELISKDTRRLLDEHLETKDMLVNSILIDHFLWD